MVELLDTALYGVAALVLSSVRLFMLTFFVPFLRGGAIPGLTQVGIVLAIASVVAPGVLAELPRPVPLGLWFPVVLKEAFIGLVMGLVVGAVFWMMDALGVIVDQQTGSSQATVMDPAGGHPQGPTGTFLTYTFSALLLSSGAFLVILGGAYDSYVLWPVLAPMPALPANFAAILAEEFGRQASFGAALALPFLVALVCVEVAVGLAGRALPSMDGHTFAQGLKQLTAQLVLLVLLGVVLSRVLEYMATFPISSLMKRLLGA